MSIPLPRKPGRPRDECLAQRRCSEILPTAIRHFAEHGYADADLEKVAGDLGCAKGTIFRYFPTKRALFEAAVDFVMREFLAQTEPPPELTGLEHLRDVLRRTLAFFDAHPEYVEILIQERAVFKDRDRPSFFEYLENHCGDDADCQIRRMLEDGTLRDMTPEHLFDVVSRLIYGTIFTHYFVRRTKTHQQHADELIDVLFHGLVNKEAAPAAASKTKPRNARPKAIRPATKGAPS